jgi:hypothetical protein
MRFRFIRSAALALALVAATAGVAAAHDCINTSRSDQGTRMAGTHATVWVYFGTLEDLFAEPPDPSLPALTPSQIDWALAAAYAAGAPSSLAVYIGNHTIAEGTPGMEKHGADGHGIDHFSDWVPKLIAIYFQALEH